MKSKIISERIPELTAEDLYITIKHIKNPQPSERFVWKINQITIKDKYDNIKSEPQNWIEFGGKWYDKSKLVNKE